MLKNGIAELVFFIDRQLRKYQMAFQANHANKLPAHHDIAGPEPTQRHFKIGTFKGFIFDMDGLVLDTEPTYFNAWQQALKIMGYQVKPDDFINLSGSTYQAVECRLKSLLGQNMNMQKFKQKSTRCWRKHVRLHGIAIKPGVIDLLDYAAQNNIPVCLATNSWAVYAKHCLAIAGLRYRFPLMVTGDDVEQVKPAPDIFLKAAQLMGQTIQDCVIFEDSPIGIQAASASGAFSVYVPSTFPIDAKTVALSDCSLDDLTQVFETLPAQTSFAI